MNQARPLSAEDFATDCPVSLEHLARITRADSDALPDLLEDLPETTRARLAVWLYGRSHTHAIGVRVAALCDGASLRRAAGLVGNVLFELSRKPYAAPDYGTASARMSRRISLGGSVGRTA